MYFFNKTNDICFDIYLNNFSKFKKMKKPYFIRL